MVGLNQVITTDGYLSPGLGQAQKCGIVKPVNAYCTCIYDDGLKY